MIEVGKFEERRIHKTPHGGTYSIARFYDGKTNTYLPQAYVDCNTYSYVFRNLKQNTGYQVCVRSFVFDNGTYDFVKHGTIPGFLLKGK